MWTPIATTLAHGWTLPTRRPVTVCAPFGPDGDALAALPGTHRYTTALDAVALAAAHDAGYLAIESTGWDLTPRSQRVSLLWLHPPLDPPHPSSESAAALALRQWTPWVHPRGWIVAILPESLWTSVPSIAPTLDRFWSMIAQWTHPLETGEPGRIVLAQPRHPSSPPNPSPDVPVPPWDPAATLLPQWILPTTVPWRLTSQAPAPTRQAWTVSEPTLWDRLRDETAPRPNLSPTQPMATPLPLHRGHLAMLLIAGRLTGTIGTGEARHLVKGRVIPYTQVIEDAPTHRVSETRYRMELHTLHPDGTLRPWQPVIESPLLSPDALSDDSELDDERTSPP